MPTKEQLLAKKETKTPKPTQANATSSSTLLDVFSLKLPKLEHAVAEDLHPTSILEAKAILMLKLEAQVR